jgi:hypothetical protein
MTSPPERQGAPSFNEISKLQINPNIWKSALCRSRMKWLKFEKEVATYHSWLQTLEFGWIQF